MRGHRDGDVAELRALLCCVCVEVYGRKDGKSVVVRGVWPLVEAAAVQRSVRAVPVAVVCRNVAFGCRRRESLGCALWLICAPVANVAAMWTATPVTLFCTVISPFARPPPLCIVCSTVSLSSHCRPHTTVFFFFPCPRRERERQRKEQLYA